jgi:DNA-binding transcriptional regulator YiaG
MANRILTNPTMGEWRETMGISQREAAEALGCNRRSVAAWEQHPEAMPHYIALAMRALNMNWSKYKKPEPSEFDDNLECLTK